VKRIFIAFVTLLLLCGAFGSAWADVKGAVTSQTRDILLVAEVAEVEEKDTPVKVMDTAPGLQMAELSTNDIAVTLTADRPDGQYAIGDKIILSVTSEEDGYLTLLDFTPGGQIVVLYPNAWVEDNQVKAGETVTIPMGDTQYALRAGGPVGVDVVKAIVTDKPVQVYDENNKDVVGPFSMLKDPVAATRDILIVAAEQSAGDPGAEDDAKWGVASFAVMTDEVGGEAPTGFAIAEKDDWQAKMWANGNNLLIGERVFVKFLSNKPGKLVSLVNVGPRSSENNLLPGGTDISFQAGEILILPRPDDKWKLVAAEDAGRDSVKAKLVLDDESSAELDLLLELVVTNDSES